MSNFNSTGFPMHRGRRLRKSKNIRDLFAESSLTINDLVMPYFIREKDDEEKIISMPGIKRYTEEELLYELEEITKKNLNTISLFPKIKKGKKTTNGSESLNSNNLVCKTLRKIKKNFPEITVICDVALDAYTSSGHDGIINSDGIIDNDKTIKMLAQMAELFASNGCDIVAPSDMMDGRIKVIRKKLEESKNFNTCILSYSSKFASNFYSPFRDALGSQKNLNNSPKDTYQIDYRNKREAIKESLEDINEGADILMVKPAIYYLDILSEIKQKSNVPVAAYQVSGEYSMIKLGAQNGILKLKECVLESLLCIKRSGADIIFSYFSKDVINWLHE